jgi:hypothetical protein
MRARLVFHIIVSLLPHRENGGMNAMSATASRVAYLFLDEGGNFDFSKNGTAYFTLTSVLAFRPFLVDAPLIELKFDLIEAGHDQEFFHATEDKQLVRDRVFALLQPHLSHIRIDSVIVEKRKTAPSARDDSRFYPDNMGYLLRYVMAPWRVRQWSKVVVVTDRIPVNKKRKSIEKAIQQSLAAKLPNSTPYQIHHHDSKSCCGLQIADYVNWAIGRKWERGDFRSYNLVCSAIRSEFDVYQHGTTIWY